MIVKIPRSEVEKVFIEVHEEAKEKYDVKTLENNNIYSMYEDLARFMRK